MIVNVRQTSKWWSQGYTREWWKSLSRAERQVFIASRTDLEIEEFIHDWLVWARDEQLAPDWDWDTWLMLCGRGFGKTRTAVETLIGWVQEGWCRRIAIVGQGEDDVRQVMVEGESGFLECSPSWNKPIFQPSVGGGMLTWHKYGSRAFIYSIEDTEALRGPQFHAGWCDEPMAAPRAKRERALDNLEFCLRLGEHPRLIITTTPKPDPWLRQMERESRTRENKIAITTGSTDDNRDNLAANFIKKIHRKYDGTKKGRQEIEGKILGDEEGALWTEDGLEKCRLPCGDIRAFADTCDKVVIGVDPNTKAETAAARKAAVAHAAGIVVVASKGSQRYVLADRSVAGGPAKWSQAVIDAAIEFDADEIVAERNQGGEMIRIILRQKMADEDFTIPIYLAWSKKSKEGRAEPVSTLYEAGDVKHVGPQKPFADLELQMMYLHEGEDPTLEDFDRCDALVWGLTRLGLKKRKTSKKSSGGGGFTTFGDMTNGPAHQGSGASQSDHWGDAEL